MMIKLSHGTLKKYKLKFQQELSNTLPNHNSQREGFMQIEALKSFPFPKDQTLLFHKNLSVIY